ncbi:MAG: family 43 glycosylhydrolase [Oscillospiraceae bacterium]|nr:family 43 glycosylhydrolase [Oscillospiraceae bacterium]
MQLNNPILTGFHADPCICRRGDDYYIAVSSFEWFPGIPVYHSRDMKHWELYTHVLTDEKTCDLRGLPSAKGVWAPCLTWCEQDQLFYVVYGVMNSMNARYFDIDNYLITAPDIRGPWSEPVYLHSAGFDASLLHDTDGRKWLVSLDWETREGYDKPGEICIVEYDPEQKRVVGYPQRIWRGGTDRGCLEAPHLTKRGAYYYLMCAEGGTGYYHCATMARSKNVLGPYEGDPQNPILTSVSDNRNERADTDHLKPRYYNPNRYLQKCGHGSYVETSLGEVYLAHLCARPFVPELRCTLGRETALQKMVWTDDGWLRLASGGNLAEAVTEGSALPDAPVARLPERDDFDGETLGIQYYAPRISPARFCDLTSRPGWLRLRGQESLASQNRVSLLARKLTSVNAEIETRMDFSPEMHHHSAGLVLYYDNMNYAYLRKYRSETLGCEALSVIRVRNGEKTECPGSRIPAPGGAVHLRLRIEGRASQFSWSADGADWQDIGPAIDTSEFSDEFSQYGEFTGSFVGLACVDLLMHQMHADFDCFLYRDLEPELLGQHERSRARIGSDPDQTDLRRRLQSIRTELRDNERSHNSYDQELREQTCIQNGDLEGLYRAISEVELEKLGVLSHDDLRNWKDLAIVVITLAARSAIRGGISPEAAFSMNDAFVQQVEAQSTAEQAYAVGRKAEAEFCIAVREHSRSATTNPLVLRCRNLISQRIHGRITVSGLAEELNISPDYLSQLFSREEGLPLSEFISRSKARFAAQELIFTDRPIDDIAVSLGFSSQSHFGKVFKRWFGMTPKQYRVQHRHAAEN